MSEPRRRSLLAAFGAAAALPLDAFGQAPARSFRVGVLVGAGSDARDYAFAALRAGLRDLGFVEGRSVALDQRIDLEGTEASLAQAARELAALEPDVVVAANTPPVVAMRQASPRTPIVMVATGDPVGAGLVESLARPGGTVTGLSAPDVEHTAKRLELLALVVPGVRRVGLIASPDNPLFTLQLRNAEAAASARGIELLREEVTGSSQLDRAFKSIVERKGTAVMRLGGFRSREAVKRLAELAAQHRLPFCSDRLLEVEQGLLMSYGPNIAATFRQAAGMVAAILKGARPADMPVQPAARFDLAVNMKTAKALGIVFPATVLARANAVVEP